MKLGIKSAAAALLATLVLVGCGQKEESKTLKVGAIAGPETELIETAAKTQGPAALLGEYLRRNRHVVGPAGRNLVGRPLLGRVGPG